jgi:hypothetical protein
VELFIVIDFLNKTMLDDILYLLKTFKVPVFLMPVDLCYEYIEKNKDKLRRLINDYLIKITKTLITLKKYQINDLITNFKPKDRRDIKIPPI